MRIETVSAGPQLSADMELLPHVLLVLDGFPELMGGGERIALQLAELLPRHGYRVSILTFFIHPKSASRLAELFCPLYLLPLTLTYDMNAFRAAFALRRFLRQQNVRIVQTFFESSDIWGGAVTRLMSKAKLIWSRRDMGILRNRKHRWAYRMMRRLPHRVFAVSEEVREHVIAVDGVPKDRVITIYNGVNDGDGGAAEGVRFPKDKVPFVVTVGNIRRVKGHDILVRAAATVLQQHPSAMFAVAGGVLEDGYFAELQSLVREFGMEEHFCFLGSVNDARSLLSKADIFVLPSRSEGFSNAIVEAMICSLPVVASRVGGNAEAVQAGISGVIVEPDAPAALSNALTWLLSNPEEARRMGSAGRAYAISNFTVEIMLRRTTLSYDELLRAVSPIIRHQ